MPVYSYQCNSCGIMDINQSIHEGALTRCPSCNSKQFIKKIGISGIQFKGKGFYSTDSRGK